MRYKEKCTDSGLPGNGYVTERGDQLACSGGCLQLKASHPSEAIYVPTEQKHWWTGAPSTLPGSVTPSPASPRIFFPTSVNYSGHTGGISSSCLFQRALKDPQTDWKHGSAFQSEKKNPFSFWKWSYGWVLPSLKANAKQCIWGKDDSFT